MTTNTDDDDIDVRILLVLLFILLIFTYILFFYGVPKTSEMLAKEVRTAQIANAYETSGLDRTPSADTYINEYFRCRSGFFAESSMTCLNSVQSVLERSTIPDDKKVRISAGLETIAFSD